MADALKAVGGVLLLTAGVAWFVYWLVGGVVCAFVEIPKRVIAGVVALSVIATWALLAVAVLAPSDRASPRPRPKPHPVLSFCDTHACIPSFYDGNGYVVQCADGMWSHSGGEPGACSYHGGVG